MMLLLMGDVLKYPRQVALAETDYSVSSLPTQCLGTQLLIRVKRAASLEIFHQITDGHLRFDRVRKMDICLSAANAVQEDAFRLLAAITEEVVHNLLNRRHKNGGIVFRVPIEMQENLVIDVR